MHAQFSSQHAFPLANVSLFVGFIALYLHVSITTFSVLSGANMASSSKSNTPGSHRLGPWVANSFLVVFVPAMVIVMIVLGVLTSNAWKEFALRWTDLHEALLDAAAQWQAAPGSVSSEALANINNLAQIRVDAYYRYDKIMRASTIVYAVFAALILLVNLAGGLLLLARLRRARHAAGKAVPTGQRIVARLDPFVSDSEQGKELVETFKGVAAAEQSASLEPWERELEEAQTETMALEWGVVLFFFSVAPVLLFVIGTSAYFCTHSTKVITNGHAYEFLLTGVVWLSTVFAFTSMVALSIKMILTNPAAAHPEIKANPSETVEINLNRRMGRPSIDQRVLTRRIEEEDTLSVDEDKDEPPSRV